MLLVLVEQVVENLLIKESDTFEIVSGARFETDNFIDQAVGLMRQIGNVLLSLDFLLDVGGIVTDLQLNRVYLNDQLGANRCTY